MSFLQPICSRCKVNEKGYTKSGNRRWYCPSCQRMYLREQRKRDLSHVHEIHKKWRDKNLKRLNFYHWKGKLRREYGISVEQYESMLNDQKGRCFICDQIPVGKCGREKYAKLHIDHDHVTGNVRALLCNKCNSALGLVNEDPLLLMKMIYYLDKFKKAEAV